MCSTALHSANAGGYELCSRKRPGRKKGEGGEDEFVGRWIPWPCWPCSCNTSNSSTARAVGRRYGMERGRLVHFDCNPHINWLKETMELYPQFLCTSERMYRSVNNWESVKILKPSFPNVF